MSATKPRIISRAEWGASPLVTPASPIKVPTPELWAHHTAGEQFGSAGMRMLQAFTLHRQDAHYVDLEYSFVVDHQSCEIFESRGPGKNTAATGGHNDVSHAVCVMGNFQTDPVSSQLVETLANLVAWGYEQGWWPLKFTGGHRDASGNSTACPGDHLEAAIAQINQRAADIHAGGTPPPRPPVTHSEEPMLIPSNSQPVPNRFRGAIVDIAAKTMTARGGAIIKPALDPLESSSPWLGCYIKAPGTFVIVVDPAGADDGAEYQHTVT